MSRFKVDRDLQRTCQHPQAEEQSRSVWEDQNGNRISLIHFHCPRCGMFFARDVQLRRRA